MMTKIQSENNMYPPIHVMYPFECDDVEIAPRESVLDYRMERAAVKRAEPEEEPLPKLNGMPLWPSLVDIRDALGRDYPWKKELDRALVIRSMLISTAAIGMCVLGLILIV